MRSTLTQSLREYVHEVRRAYFSFVFGGLLAVGGAVGFFVSDQQWLRTFSVAGMVVGGLVAPLQAFHSMRLQRDVARGQDPFGRLRLITGFVNALSGSNWGIDHFAAVADDGFAVRVVVGARYGVRSDHEFDTETMLAIRDALTATSLERWMRALPISDEGDASWELVSPSNDYVVTVGRDPVPLVAAGSEVYARVTVQTPRSFSGIWPMLLVDVVARNRLETDVRTARSRGAEADIPALESLRFDLPQFVALLETLAHTAVEELGPSVFGPMVKRRWRERVLRRRLRLIGPNFDARARPGAVIDFLRLPEFTRVSGASGHERFFFETPDGVDPRDSATRLELIRRAIRAFLRRQEFIGFESYVDSLGSDEALDRVRQSPIELPSSPTRG